MNGALRLIWVAALGAGLSAAAADQAPVVANAASPTDAPKASEVHARIDVAQLLAGDDLTAQRVTYTDLRAILDGARLGGTKVSFHLDGRGRKGWTQVSPEDRLTVTEAYVRYGVETDAWRFTAGRQLIRPVASAEVDGVGVERQLTKDVQAVAFAGLLPHPLTGDPNVDFLSAGLGYDGRGERSNHNGGAAVSLYRGTLNRFYLTQNSYLAVSPQVVFSGFAIVDLVAAQGLLGGPGPDLTSLNLMARFRPVRAFDSTLSLNHNHTLLPGKWWHDWLTEQQRSQGFLLDGEEPVGTRISSARWTNVFWVTRATAPYVRLRYDVRHTENAQGYEAAAGFKWRPKLGYLDASAVYRRFFGAEGELVNLQAGVDTAAWGLEAGASGLRSRPLTQTEYSLSCEVHAFAWIELGELIAGAKGIRAMVQYQGFIQPRTLSHAVLGQLGYRF